MSESQHRSDASAGAGKGWKTTDHRRATEAIATMTQTGRYRKLNLARPSFGHELAVINGKGAFLDVIC